jgi:hypothetical protein
MNSADGATGMIGADEWRDRFELIDYKPDAYKVFYHPGGARADTLVITFSTAREDYDFEPFGAHFLAGQGFAHLHFGQAWGSNFQELSLDEFQKIAASFCVGKTIITYGSSLGGYAAIFYGGTINARAIAATPINPGHPIAVHPSKRAGMQFKHPEIVASPRSSHDPIILYDDEVPTDHRFVETCILPAYPNAKRMIIKHCGHGGALRILKEIGALKAVILDLIAGRSVDLQTEDYIRRFMDTHQYAMERARFCVSKGKVDEAVRWARRMVAMNRSLRAYRILLAALMRLDNKRPAQKAYNEAVPNFPELRTLFPELAANRSVGIFSTIKRWFVKERR